MNRSGWVFGVILLILLVLLSGMPHPAAAQEFTPPETSMKKGVHLGLFGIGTRLGADFKQNDQIVSSITLDLGNVGSDRFRLRGSSEIGFGSPPDTYLGALEVVYRFTRDIEPAVPYVGAGVGVWGHQNCDGFTLEDTCPAVWPMFALGFELRLSNKFNWLLEYHSEQTFSRHRLFIGITTRRS